jgi:hypothetical protein
MFYPRISFCVDLKCHYCIFYSQIHTTLDGSEKSLNEALLELDWYAKLSGLNINYTKTQVVWIGSKKYSNDTSGQHRNLSWGKTSFKLL